RQPRGPLPTAARRVSLGDGSEAPHRWGSPADRVRGPDGGASMVPGGCVDPIPGRSSNGRLEPMSGGASPTSGVWGWPRRWPVVVVVLGLALGAAAVAKWWLGRRSSASERHLRAASRDLSEGRLEEAAAELGRAHEPGESSAAVERLWGLVYARAGRPDDALPLLWRAWEGPRVGGGGPDPEVAEALARITMERF